MHIHLHVTKAFSFTGFLPPPGSLPALRITVLRALRSLRQSGTQPTLPSSGSPYPFPGPRNLRATRLSQRAAHTAKLAHSGLRSLRQPGVAAHNSKHAPGSIALGDCGLSGVAACAGPQHQTRAAQAPSSHCALPGNAPVVHGSVRLGLPPTLPNSASPDPLPGLRSGSLGLPPTLPNSASPDPLPGLRSGSLGLPPTLPNSASPDPLPGLRSGSLGLQPHRHTQAAQRAAQDCVTLAQDRAGRLSCQRAWGSEQQHQTRAGPAPPCLSAGAAPGLPLQAAPACSAGLRAL